MSLISLSDNVTAPDPEGGNGSDVDVCQQDAWDLECVTRRLWQILAPVIIVVGLLGNLLVVIVFSRLRFSKSSTLVHMFVLAITDSVILCLGITRHWALYTFDFDIRGISDAGCKLHLFLLYTTLDYSAWILVSVTVERALSVLRPLHVRGWFTVRRTLIRLSLILVILVGINGHFFSSNGLVASSADAETNPGWNKTEVTTTLLTTTTAVQSIGNISVTSGCSPHSGATSAVTPGVTSGVAVQPNTVATAPAWDQRNDFPVSSSSSTNVAPTHRTSSLGQVTRYECRSVSEAWDHFEEFIFVYIALCFESFVPFLVMIVCNSLIVVSIRRAMKNRPHGITRRELQAFAGPSRNGHVAHTVGSRLANGHNLNHLDTKSECAGAEESSDFENDVHSSVSVDDQHSAIPDHPGAASQRLASSPSHQQNGQRRRPTRSGGTSAAVTRMLVVVTTVFVMTTLPSVIFFVVDSYLRDKRPGYEKAHVNQVLDLSKAVTGLLQYSNYGCNFLLYSMHSKRFLREAKVLFGLVSRRLRSYVTSRGNSGSGSHSSTQAVSLQQTTAGRDERASLAGDLVTCPAVDLLAVCRDPQPDTPRSGLTSLCGASGPGEITSLNNDGTPCVLAAYAHDTLDLRAGSDSVSELSITYI